MTTVSGCERELNAHFYSAASLKYHAMIPHPVTLSWHRVDQSQLCPVSLRAKQGAASTILTTLVCRGPGVEPMSSRSSRWTFYQLSYRGPVLFEETDSRDSRDKFFSKELTEWTVIIVELFLDIFNGILSRIVTQVLVCTGDFVLANWYRTDVIKYFISRQKTPGASFIKQISSYELCTSNVK